MDATINPPSGPQRSRLPWIEHPGVWLPAEVISHQRFFEAFALLGFLASVQESPSVNGRGHRRRIGQATQRRFGRTS